MTPGPPKDPNRGATLRNEVARTRHRPRPALPPPGGGRGPLSPPATGDAGRTVLQRLLREDLDFHGASREAATHTWHPFPAKFPPRLPRRFIEALSAPGETVLDPMAGSGTTLVEAQRGGRRGIGCDIDPLARLIVSTKLTPLDPSDATEAGREVLRMAEADYETHAATLRDALDDRFDSRTRAFVDYWFPPRQQLELVALSRHIEAISDEAIRNFLKVVLSSTIIAKSGGVSLARDLAHTRPHRVLDKTPRSAFAEFPRRLERNLSTVQQERRLGAPDELHGSVESDWRILDASAEQTGLPPGSADLIVTSPPYANGAIDYMRAHKFSLVWLGWKLDDLTALRRRYLGHDAAHTGPWVPLPERCERVLSALGKLDRRKASALRRYFGEMAGVLAEMRRVLRSGRSAIVVVGTSVLRGLDVETHECLAAIGEACGLNLAGIGVRRLDRDRRMMPARWGDRGPSQIEARMHEEYVIGFVKP